MAVQKKIYNTEAFEQFIDLPENADRLFEFIGGDVVEVPSNPYSSSIGGWFLTFINLFLLKNPIGHTTGEAGLYSVFGERYAPDVGYISKAHQPELARRGPNPNPPDLAIEVISPTDNTRDVSIKLSNYLAAGTVVWVVYPDEQQVVVHSPGQPAQIVNIDGVLHGGDVLPGFTLPLRDVFAR